jgi:hypothetical protein
MDKNEQIRRAEEELDQLITLVETLNTTQLADRAIGDWSVREILAHITGWARLDTEILRRIARGERPLPEGEEYGTGDSRNPGFAAAAADQTPDEALGELRGAFAEFIAAAESVPEDRFAGDRTAGRIMHSSGIGHVAEHREEIAAYARQLKRG